MAAADYVLVPTDSAIKTILGAYRWDGEALLRLPAGTQLILRSAAEAGGYAPVPLTAEETNSATLRDRAQQALAANATYLALGNPSNAQVVQQVGRLTRECSAVIRLLLGLLDTTDGT